MRMRKKKNLNPRMEACAALWIRKPTEYKGRWRELKPDAAMVRLEIGCGKGRFTAQTAAAHPEDLYVAVERVPDAMVIAMERCRDMGLTNVFFIDGDAAVLSDYFAPDEVDLLYINFCDPWPSLKHAPRRLTHENFLRSYRRVLKDGGQIHFKSDNRDLFEWSLFQFPKAGFELSEVSRDLHANGICGIMTDYEEKFHQLGTPINRCVGTKVLLPDVPVEEGLRAALPGYEVRPVEDGDEEAVLSLMKGNADFYALTGCVPTPAEVCKDRTALPPRCIMEQKRYLALWRDGAPAVLLDLITGYPRERTLFVGLFEVAAPLHRTGVGRETLNALLSAANGAGMDSVRLACLKNNAAGRAFWDAMGFSPVRESETSDGYPIWIMEHRL